MAISERIADIQRFLRQTPIFQTASDEHVAALAVIAIPQTYRRGETLFLEGDEGTGFFIVKSGRVKVFKVGKDGKEQILHIFGPEEYFAEVPAFDGGQFPASAAALESVEVLFIPRATFLIVLEQHPTLAIAMLSTFARHLRRLAHLVDSLSFKDVPQRLANYLLNLSDRDSQSDIVELDLPKGQLAALLGTIPETLSRTFYKLSQEGVIEITGTTIRLCNRDRLRELGHRD
ncbi:Crp/Fnr family transcriptional regulator [Leptolyngbya sp. FACHB-8]|uniref:Crp/Fnr family transcriptional regulator n=1 Tax=unclassified Leptolyngbya TaxID=2650499 RepID=UPI001688FB2F|nr:Crp/Fnr family transcriptional regulator [Leptolyngbya sp. FACHB-8]MBD1909093.1 Crp/Fnr family transcriptional regulator [Leptolyngbya sp. FACHB-8]